MERYEVNLTGAAPLLLHADDLAWRAELDKWLAVPEHKKASKAGDDRTPAWKWIGYCYHDGHVLGMPSDNLMTAMREGGAQVPTGKRGGTYKKQSQSGIVVDQLIWPLAGAIGEVVQYEPIKALLTEKDYEKHEEAVKPLGFWLFAKGAKVGQSKHVRVRPRFDTWSCSGTVTVVDETITAEILQTILDMAGMYCGLGDWRPSSPSKPGPFGRFRADVRRIR